MHFKTLIPLLIASHGGSALASVLGPRDAAPFAAIDGQTCPDADGLAVATHLDYPVAVNHTFRVHCGTGVLDGESHWRYAADLRACMDICTGICGCTGVTAFGDYKCRFHNEKSTMINNETSVYLRVESGLMSCPYNVKMD